jgi:lysozyme
MKRLKDMRKVQQSIVEHEGFKSTPYPDPLHGWKIPTFGHGLTYITEKESADIVNKRIVRIDTILRGELRFYKNLPESAKHVLIEMAYQMGIAGLMDFGKTLMLLEEWDFQGAAKEMLDSKWATQTPQRAQELSDRIANLS